MRRLTIGLLLTFAAAAQGQTSIAACGPLPDSTSKQIIKTFGSLKVCLVAMRPGPDALMPREWAATGSSVIIETQRADDNRRAVIEGNRVSWTINGRPAPVDSLADRWQQSVLDLLDASYEADGLREQANDLRTQIDSLPARRDRTRARIDQIERLQTQLSQQMRSAQDQETLRRNDIQRLERQADDYERRAGAEERRAASLTDPRARQSADDNARGYRQQAQNIREQIRRIEYSSSDVGKRIADIQEQLRALTSDGGVTLLKMQLANYDSTRVEDLEQQLTQLGAQQRLPDLEARVEKARLALLAVLEVRGTAASR